MKSEIEAAAERVKLLAEQGKDDPDFLLDSIVPFCDDAEFVASHVLARLAADRADRAARAHVVTTEMLAEIRESLERLQGQRQCGNCGRAVIDPLCPYCWQGEDYDIPIETLLPIVSELIDRRERAKEGGS